MTNDPEDFIYFTFKFLMNGVSDDFNTIIIKNEELIQSLRHLQKTTTDKWRKKTANKHIKIFEEIIKTLRKLRDKYYPIEPSFEVFTKKERKKIQNLLRKSINMYGEILTTMIMKESEKNANE